MKALISVYDKTGIIEFAKKLVDSGVELISTGGTHATLSREGSLPVLQVSDVTGSPEILDGRVKTLHPIIHAGLLAKRDLNTHMEELRSQNISPIDIVVVNLYPFGETINKPNVTFEEALENIDIGGPTMLRAAAKNHQSVAVIVDPKDYQWVSEKVSENSLNAQDLRELAAKAFHHVAQYDALIANYLSSSETDKDVMPENVTVSLTKTAPLRYGENPHQSGALYLPDGITSGGLAGARQLHGRELSYNNYMDADAAWRIVTDFSENSSVVIKHANPCGLASHTEQVIAYNNAFEGDTVSAFGGIVGFNRTLDRATAEAMSPVFYEVVVAPDYTPDALEILTQKRNLRILAVDPVSQGRQFTGYDYRVISGGILVQHLDTSLDDPNLWQTATDREPTEQERRDLAFAWKAVKHIKSNAIVFAKGQTLVGMGAGQPNRVVSVHLAQRIADAKAIGSVIASDAFFPFPDNIELAHQAGITAIIQPGGSIRDDEVIAEANKNNMAMLFTGIRHFRH